jgi:hypothetical protein
MKVTTVGIDLAKNVLALSGANRNGRVVLRKQFRRAQLLSFLGTLEPAWWGFRRAAARITLRAQLVPSAIRSG